MSALSVAENLVKQFEGCELEAYPDPATGGEPITIGWGSTFPGLKLGTTWTQEQADQRLASDLEKFMAGVRKLLVPMPTDGELGALTSFAYNVGLGNLQKSTLLKLYNKGDKIGASKEFPKWNKAAGKVMKGLVRRREAEQRAFLS